MSALLVVDLQNDFLPGGALGVKGGDQIVPLIDSLVKKPFDVIVASKDWHPKGHVSFASRHHVTPGHVVQLPDSEQILWPDHCVQKSQGAEFCPGWDVSKVEAVFYKGIDPEIDSYSAFFDNQHRRSTGLASYLREKGIETLYIAGLTTEYCVAYSVHDAIQLGFKTYVVLDACRGVELHPGDVENAERKMQELGALFVKTNDLFT